jgi:hypothetical protein
LDKVKASFVSLSALVNIFGNVGYGVSGGPQYCTVRAVRPFDAACLTYSQTVALLEGDHTFWCRQPHVPRNGSHASQARFSGRGDFLCVTSVKCAVMHHFSQTIGDK